jgi:hypothetical protein
MVLSGNFKNAHFDDFLHQNKADLSVDQQPYGDNGTVYTVTPPALPDGGTTSGMSFASWNDQLLFLGGKPDEAQQAIDRVEGRSPSEPAIGEDQTYGDIYGTLSPQALSEMLPPDQQQMKDQLLAAAQKIELHVDATNDVGVSLSVKGDDSGQIEDLGRTLAGGLAALRIEAKAKGEDEAAELLDDARVMPQGNSFGVGMAVPMAWFEKQLAWCRDPAARAAHFHLDAGQ